MTVDPNRFEELLQRVQAAYLDSPGLRLTLAQAQRLWGLDRKACLVMLNALIDEQFLRRETDGRYARAEPPASRSSTDSVA